MADPTIRREQVAGMNIHYINYSLDYFLDAQQRAGFKTIELWCAAPHVWLDHLAYFDAKEIAQKIRARDLTVQVLTPENCTYPYQFAAKEPEHIQRSFGYFSNGIRLAQELGCQYMEVNSGWGYWNEDREEAWKRSREMLSRLAEAAGRPLPEQMATFTDMSGVSSYAVGPVGKMQATGIMSGVGDNTFAPQNPYTREQSIITILRLFNAMK